MMGVDGLGGNWLGGVAAKAGSDEIRMDNLGNGTIMVHSLVWMRGGAVVSTMMGVGSLVGNWFGGVTAKAGSDEIRMNNLGDGTIMVHSLV